MSREKLSYMILAIIIFLGVLVRFYQFSTPLADWHSFRQADTASVAREYIKHGIDPLIPKYHDISNIQSGSDNPEGYRMVEMPYINAGVALTFPFFRSVLDLHQYYRLTSIIFSAFSIFFIYLLAKELDTSKVGLLAAAVYAFLPFSIYYSRTVLPEVPLIFFSLLGMYSFLKIVNTNRLLWLLIYCISFTLAILLKPTAAFYLIPLFTYAIFKKGFKFIMNPKILVSTLILFIPFIMWRSWIQQYPEGIPVFDKLLNANLFVDTKGLRFRPAFFNWIFSKRIGQLILGSWGLVFLITGFLYPKTNIIDMSVSNIKKSISKILVYNRGQDNQYSSQQLSHLFYNSWTIGLIIYLNIFATGNVQHDYYQVILLPLVAVLVAKGILFFWSQKTYTAYSITLITIIFSLAFSWYEIRGFFNINNWAIVAAGQAVDEKTPPDALVIAPYMGDTAFLYQTNRRGWPLGHQIQDKIEMGAEYYVSTSYDDEARELESQYTLIEKTDDYILINLK